MEIIEIVKSIFKSQFHSIGKYIYRMHRYNQHSINLIVLFICDKIECGNDVYNKYIDFVISDIEYLHCIKLALEKVYNVTVIIDNGEESEELKSGLLKIKENFNENFDVYICDIPLEEHYVFMDGYYIRENKNGCIDQWVDSTIIEKPTDDFMENIFSRFNILLMHSKIMENKKVISIFTKQMTKSDGTTEMILKKL